MVCNERADPNFIAHMQEYFELGYAALFLVCFLAATILPFSSEAFFVLMILVPFDAIWCVIVASMGNWLGGMTCYYLGHLGKTDLLVKWFKVSELKIRSLEYRIKKFGPLSALMCWLPFVGDPIAIALGFFRAAVIPVAIFMFIGKMARYAFLAITLAP